MGRTVNRIKTHIPDRIWQLLRIIFNPKRPKDKLRVEVHVVEHCNLNCRGCDNFSCIASPEFLDIDVFTRDLKRLREVFGDDVEWISLMGGEPLLNDNISEYCKVARNLYPNAIIRIITNGTLLLNKDDVFWDDLKKYDVLLYVTKYPITFDYDRAELIAREKGVKFQFAFESGDVLKTMYKTPIDLEGKQNAKVSYWLCGKGNKCITLRQGKLYTCEFLANISTFNSYFGKDIKIGEDDYIDIYRVDDPKAIMKKMASPAPACRYCDNLHYCSGIPWEVTKKKIEEWIR